jgi:hypothetical protein
MSDELSTYKNLRLAETGESCRFSTLQNGGDFFHFVAAARTVFRGHVSEKSHSMGSRNEAQPGKATDFSRVFDQSNRGRIEVRELFSFLPRVSKVLRSRTAILFTVASLENR